MKAAQAAAITRIRAIVAISGKMTRVDVGELEVATIRASEF